LAVDIHATGQNIITLGDGNVVNAKYSDLRSALDDFKQTVTGAAELVDSTKLDLAVDIESIKDQLAKPEPDKTIVGHLWRGVEKIATAAGFADACAKVLPYIQALLPH